MISNKVVVEGCVQYKEVGRRDGLDHLFVASTLHLWMALGSDIFVWQSSCIPRPSGYLDNQSSLIRNRPSSPACPLFLGIQQTNGLLIRCAFLVHMTYRIQVTGARGEFLTHVDKTWSFRGTTDLLRFPPQRISGGMIIGSGCSL